MDMKSVDFNIELGDIKINERAIDSCEFHIRTNNVLMCNNVPQHYLFFNVFLITFVKGL